jgi:[FeFe] hydrogenase H-cluster maturation GTPase HydF
VQAGLQGPDRELIALFEQKKIPYVIAYNKADLTDGAAEPEAEIPAACKADEPEAEEKVACKAGEPEADDKGTYKADKDAGRKESLQDDENRTQCSIFVSARTGQNIYELKELIGHLVRQEENQKRLVADLLRPGDVVVLVVPIDSAAPKGRLILPQQQTIRDALEAGATVTVTRESELTQTLEALKQKPKLVITDSQVFGRVSKETPDDVLLTSFSILMVRYKGNLEAAVRGAAQLDHLKDGDTVLISEGCTHHRQCDDIGTVKMPGWLRNYTGADLKFEFTSGAGFPEDLSKYALIVHCGGCMLNEREMHSRTGQAQDAGVPMTNYGIAIAQMHGILRRSLSPFPELLNVLNSVAQP